MALCYQYTSELPLFAHTFSYREDHPLTIAIASFSLETQNFIQLVSFDRKLSNFVSFDQFPLHFPQSDLEFLPSTNISNPDLLLSSSDAIRLFEIKDTKIHLKGVISQENDVFPVKCSRFNPNNLSQIFSTTSNNSITVFDLITEKQTNQTQISNPNKGVFSSNEIIIGGEVGLFSWDTRQPTPQLITTTTATVLETQMQQNTIIFTQNQSQKVYSIDRRMPEKVTKMVDHTKQVTGISASKAVSAFLSCSADGNLLVWDDLKSGRPALGVKTDCEIESCCWGCGDGKWVSFVSGKELKVVSLF